MVANTPNVETTGRGSTPRAELLPITDDDLDEVGRFLGAYYPPDTSSEDWGNAWRDTVNLSGSEAPNHGFLLRAGGKVVGAYPAIYSTRIIEGQLERFCNLAVWCVSPEYRLQSLSMLKAILAQKDYHFTDLTPIDRVQKLNAALGFRYLDTTTALAINLPWSSPLGRTRISADPNVIEATVTGQVKTFYQDHAACRWANHLILTRGDEWCYLQWRRESRKKLPLFISLRYVSHKDVLRRSFRSLGNYFLLRHFAPFTIAELRMTGGQISASMLISKPTRRMFKSATLRPDVIDYLYSEVTSAP